MGRVAHDKRPRGFAQCVEALSAYISKCNQAVKDGWRCAAALVLTVVLTAQMLLSSGFCQAVSYAYAAGNALAGATFHVTGTFADGSAECTVVSSADGTIDLTQLVAGETYTVEETDTPTGYQLIEGTFSFTVTEDGMIEAESTATSQLFGGWTAGYTVSDDGLTLTAINVAAPDQQLSGDLPTTGDSARFVGLIAAAGVVLLGAGLAYRHRRKFTDKR